MTRECGTCGRSWDGRAVFCGACGDLLDASAITRVERGGPTSDRGARLLTIGLIGAALVIGAVAAVPRLTIDRTPPVSGEIGVPDTDALRDAPRGGRARTTTASPEITCTRDDQAVDCVAWSRRLTAPEDPERGGGGWPAALPGDVIVMTDDDGVTVVDARTGTRRWRGRQSSGIPVGATQDVLILQGSRGIRAVGLADGETRWEVEPRGELWGDVVRDGVVYTRTGRDVEEAGIVARDAATGDVLWTVPLDPAPSLSVQQHTDHGLLLASNTDNALHYLDATNGTLRELAFGTDTSWVIGSIADTAVLAPPPYFDEPTPGSTSLGGDPGGSLVAIDLPTGEVRWERDVPARDVEFQLANGLVLAPSTGQLAAIDLDTGETVWEVPLERGETPAYHGPIGPTPAEPSPALLTIQGHREVHGRDWETGETVWTTDVDGMQWLLAVGDQAVVFREDGFVLLDSRTGAELLTVRSTPRSNIVGVDPMLLFDPTSGYVSVVALGEEAVS